MLLERDDSNYVTIVAAEGSRAADCPRGAVYHKFSSTAAIQQGVMFAGSLRTGRGGVTAANDECLWAKSISGELRLILREMQPVEGKKLKNFNVLKAVPGSRGATRAFTDSGHIVVLATFTDGSRGILEVLLP
jgi:hypothetical protein